MSNTIIQPEGWAPAKGYANGVLAENGTLFVGGQIGWNGAQVFESHDFIGQMEQALRNIMDVVEAAGGTAVAQRYSRSWSRALTIPSPGPNWRASMHCSNGWLATG